MVYCIITFHLCVFFFGSVHQLDETNSLIKIDVRPVFGPLAGADSKEIHIECVCLLARPDCCRSVDYLDCVNRLDVVNTALVNKFLKDMVRIKNINLEIQFLVLGNYKN